MRQHNAVSDLHGRTNRLHVWNLSPKKEPLGQKKPLVGAITLKRRYMGNLLVVVKLGEYCPILRVRAL